VNRTRLGLDHGFVHLHPASRWRFKCWPADRTAALIDRLAAAGERVVLTAAPSEPELELVRAIRAACRADTVDLSGQLTLKQLAALTGRAKLFVGVDSAPMHIAAAMGTPVVALFGPSGELEWGPWGVTSRVIVSEAHPCRPCGNDGCGGGKVSECLTTLPVDRVFAAARELLAAPRG
jgi:heptosyltransferase-3